MTLTDVKPSAKSARKFFCSCVMALNFAPTAVTAILIFSLKQSTFRNFDLQGKEPFLDPRFVKLISSIPMHSSIDLQMRNPRRI